jgi:very-short-patch-repair endonuclease
MDFAIDDHLLELKCTRQTTFSLAAQQNSYPLFRDIKLHSLIHQENADKAPTTIRDLVVTLTCENDIIVAQEWEIGQISSGQYITLQDRGLIFPHSYLFDLSDEVQLSFTFTVHDRNDSSKIYLKQTEVINVLPANFWGGETRQAELLAAFVKPNGVYVESLVKQVTEVLESNGYGRTADGYQSNTREKPYLMAAALWNVISSQKIAYVSPPPSFAHNGQLVRLAQDISTTKIAACLDLSLLFASCLELMGLNTLIALTRGHAFVGVWLVDTSSPLLTTDDPMDLRKRVDARDLVIFETTLVSNSDFVTFEQACEQGRSLVSEDKEEDFVYAIDVKQARSRQIKPLSTLEQKREETESEILQTKSLSAPPPLPPVRADEIVEEETPETRIDTWQRKLLDLSKRNSLLSFKDRSAGIRIYCPDIGELEDRLAEGVQFRFMSSDSSPIEVEGRSGEFFRLQTGNDLHRDYAIEQLGKGTLIANMPQKKLDNSAISLLRKAKNDLEEGGANTLYLAIGMLRWKENPSDDKAYKAPLILLPVQLIRTSARAPIRLKQLSDEQPIFNLTLIEFLQIEHDIDLNRFREALPEDDSGVDVEGIWDFVRRAVMEQPGFEVVEECVVSAFSFAKYLMWNDLRDRIEDLKQNPFVEHLVDNPHDAYQQNAEFVLQDQVDQKIDPDKIFTPLNCDSSQLIAVEASGRPQDFVLEGPPGTGKSETIANIICHNLAIGRKVLFVAEKIAALEVVNRRIQKVGLNHLCLEMHSNKANKKAVLEQLRSAVTMRVERDTTEWLERAQLLRNRRDHLNDFVKALHKKSQYGVSPREAISRIALFQKHHLNLGWGLGFEAAPIQTESELEKLKGVVQKLSIAYQDIEDLEAYSFRIIRAKEWSNAWQSQVVQLLNDYQQITTPFLDALSDFAQEINIPLRQFTIEDAAKIGDLGKLIEQAQKIPLGYALQSGVVERLSNLRDLVEFKSLFDSQLIVIGHGASAQNISQTPIEEWLAISRDAEPNWLKSFFVMKKINKAAKRLGYQKIKESGLLLKIQDSKQLIDKINAVIPVLETDGIWMGWSTSPDHLNTKLIEGENAKQLVQRAVSLVDDPAEIIGTIRTKLIDGRDFLDTSKLVSRKQAFKDQYNKLNNVISELSQLGVEMDPIQSYAATTAAVDEILNTSQKIKPWVEWVAARDQANQCKLSALTKALEAKEILIDDTEDQFITAFCIWLAPQLIDNDNILRKFKATEHEKLIQEFRKIDAEVAKTTGQYIAAITAKSVPDISSKENAKDFSVLSRELQKKTRHKPVRTLFNEMGGRLLELCPCMMMSPLSVAQFLPSNFAGFDLVIFDEASQMTTWDSIGAIARGKNVIVVGDPKQMPPSNYFNKAVDVDDPDEEDLESILDQALAARLPHLRLMGHYRSRHETLIAFSNSKYYQNSLITYPSSDTKESAVTLHRVDGVYTKGKGRNNPIEAKAVVAKVLHHLLDPRRNHLTLGIVTLNSEQQRTIEDLLDDARRQDPSIEVFFQAADEYDPVFIKNLESVQGDERDVILFSMGYGPTELGGKTMSMNFGPLNKSGGERRLNVAITRATTEVHLFASFDSSMIDLSRTSAMAVEHLKHYIEFAEKGPIALAEQATADYGIDQFDSDFEQAVAFALRDKGWKVQTQIGVSKFRVDLGVIHPDKPGAFMAGIECDGATYHGSPSARDRDRVRQMVLENLGWRLVRLWSTDYFQDPDGAIDKIHHRLEEILAEDHERSERDQEDTPTVNMMEKLSNIQAQAVQYDVQRYFDADYESTLKELAKQILTERPCITFKALALEMANLHGLSRTSEKQRSHIYTIIKPWAGVWRDGEHRQVVWASPDDITSEIPWRGLDPFGYDRDWSEIAYPEALGLAREAIEKNPSDPVDFICNTFKLNRRHDKTLTTFRSWVESLEL